MKKTIEAVTFCFVFSVLTLSHETSKKTNEKEGVHTMKYLFTFLRVEAPSKVTQTKTISCLSIMLHDYNNSARVHLDTNWYK